MLASRIYEQKLRQRSAEKQRLHAEQPENAWGSQIRSYVLHPYQMVKDARTQHQTGKAQAVLDGDLDGFLKANIEHTAIAEPL
ncbi:hypothetical protein THASP1DRAFT_29374 [Thamnocephalis sphaerospora]|uniref:Peptide chain release factor 2 n=1 Tax=Thamnocephalis sphaerospora TaxID=78915 RepID=A0A4P9XS75_9FUNG|nr:hypothetical protein THASP1DRAFT_29374 [Thamnocephalis sphaerospora]|eukprot:RKP08822.1 hypothetical protein THASP1DRAFT_29374 [Thamnocephalis sphaerospora]